MNATHLFSLFLNIVWFWHSPNSIRLNESMLFASACAFETFRVLVGVFVMAPERDFCEAAMVLLILIFVGIVPDSLGGRPR